MSAILPKHSASDALFITSNYACTAVTYGAAVFTWVRTAAQVAAFPHVVAIGVIAGLGIRWLAESVFKNVFNLCCPCSPNSRFQHRLIGALTSLSAGVILPLQTVDPFSLGIYSGWMLGSCYKECFFTNANFSTGKPSLFGV